MNLLLNDGEKDIFSNILVTFVYFHYFLIYDCKLLV